MSYLTGSFVMRRSGVRVPNLAPLKIKKLATKEAFSKRLGLFFRVKKHSFLYLYEIVLHDCYTKLHEIMPTFKIYISKIKKERMTNIQCQLE